jgi:4-amino-4-deoxy-L-arabinose transferase-like glycosyltransferase
MARVQRAARSHPGLLMVLSLAALVRLAFAIAYRPALFYSDSWQYLALAWDHSFVGSAPYRPSGWPALVKVVSGPWHSVATVTTLQHLMGLASGVVVYALLVRLAAPRWLALVAAGVVLFDGYAITLEQTLMPEATVTLLLVASAALAVTAARAERRATLLVGASGLLLAIATTMRTAALFAAPAWLAYVWLTRGGRWRPLGAGVAALAVPLVVYASIHAATVGTFALNDAAGWFLYGRVGQIGDCRGVSVPVAARPMCAGIAAHGARGPNYFIWSPRSPAKQVFKGVSSGDERQDAILRNYALAVIAARPLRYGGIVLADFARFFVPGATAPDANDKALIPPDRARTRPPFFVRRIATRDLPGFAPRVRFPAALTLRYARVLHTPRWLMGICALLTLAVLALACLPRFRRPLEHRREVLLMGGGALLVLLLSVATAGFDLRYLIPVVPLLTCAGALAAVDLVGLARARALVPAGRRAGVRAAA